MRSPRRTHHVFAKFRLGFALVGMGGGKMEAFKYLLRKTKIGKLSVRRRKSGTTHIMLIKIINEEISSK